MASSILPTDPRFIDIAGQRFGQWLVLRLHAKKHKGYQWWCRCDCGTEKPVQGTSLRSDQTKSCGCAAPQKISESRTKDLAGRRFGQLTVLWIDRREGRKIYWLCRCDCGTEKPILAGRLREGGTQSCGHILKRWNAKTKRKCGGSKAQPEYKVWAFMKQRCYNPKNVAYKRYGGRGIVICDGWRDNFGAFVRDMGSRPTDAHSIDRIDVNKGYDCGKCPDCHSRGATANCRWVLFGDQARNRRNNVFVVHRGERMTISECSRRTGVPAGTILARKAAGWSDDRATSEPVRHRRNAASTMPADQKEKLILEVTRSLVSIRDRVRSQVGNERSRCIFKEAFDLAMLHHDQMCRELDNLVSSKPDTQ